MVRHGFAMVLQWLGLFSQRFCNGWAYFATVVQWLGTTLCSLSFSSVVLSLSSAVSRLNSAILGFSSALLGSSSP